MQSNTPLTIGIVAGEVSGDALGADFMQQMNALHSNIRWVGVGGTAMTQAGLNSLFDINRLAVMGISEVIKHLADLLSAKKEILTAFESESIDIFVGIDAPDFNLRISKALKKRLGDSIFCVQYVSPSVWAWRENRIHTIKAATDLVLCLFPFELDVYKKHNHPAVCVGHPLLQKLHPSSHTQHQNFQEFINLFKKNFHSLSTLSPSNVHPICMMAGSRLSEIRSMLGVLIDTMSILDSQGDFCYVLPVVSQEHATFIHQTLQNQAPTLLNKVHIIFGTSPDALSISQHAMNACELTILASGTATFEALLLHRPMVVIYKVSKLTYTIAKQLIKIPYYSLPNILSCHQTGLPIVPELIQADANAPNIAKHALNILNNIDAEQQKLTATTQLLRQDSHSNPAQAVLTQFFAR